MYSPGKRTTGTSSPTHHPACRARLHRTMARTLFSNRRTPDPLPNDILPGKKQHSSFTSPQATLPGRSRSGFPAELPCLSLSNPGRMAGEHRLPPVHRPARPHASDAMPGLRRTLRGKFRCTISMQQLPRAQLRLRLRYRALPQHRSGPRHGPSAEIPEATLVAQPSWQNGRRRDPR